MTAIDRHEIRRHLETKLAEAVCRLETGSVASETCPDPNEYASRLSEQDVLLAVAARTSRQAEELREALGRVDQPQFGECEECGGDIGLARLKARPTASLCIRCQSALERSLAFAS